MRLQEKIKEELKQALKDKDKIKLDALRGLSADIVNELVAKGRKPNEEAEDELVLNVIKRAIKQRKESAKEFRAGKRDDLAEKEEKEAEVLQSFMPDAPSDEEIEKVIKECKNEKGEDIGAVMSCAIAKLGPAADGAKVKEFADKILR